MEFRMLRRLLLAGVGIALLLPAVAPGVLAQEIVVQGIRIRLTDQDNAWIARACERRNLARDTEPFRQCVASMQRDILEQRGRDAIIRPSPSGP